MNPIQLLRETSLISGIETALDVGSRNGIISKELSEIGISVDAIDIDPKSSKIDGVNFELISVEDFLLKNKTKYDLVVARHVLHLVSNPKEVIRNLNSISGVFLFTCFGPKDDWAGRVNILSSDEVLEMFDIKLVKHRSEAFQYGKTYAGDMKFWHINTFIIDNTSQE